MAKNDVVLIDSVLQQMQAQDPSIDIGEHFERFVLEQILKNFDLSKEEIEFGWTDGSHDGGIDGFYVLVNGLLLTDPTDFAWPRTGADIQVILLTCKHHSTFQQAPLDALLASTQEIFDLTLSNAQLSGKYSGDIKRCRDSFVAAFQHLSIYRPTISFNIYYASRGETALLGESITARSAQLKALFHQYFSAAQVEFIPLGASELVELHREVRSFALDLPVLECLTAGQEGYVVLARLSDYCRFVQDEKGALRRYLFDSNVRAFLGANLVNADIAETLSNKVGPNFWWLNNGVTILATSASLVGKTLKLRDIQIVNGLQTTESIHRHFVTAIAGANESRALLVKIIVSQDETVRDQVIRATNNQSAVEPAALHATDRIQRNIEEILFRSDWFYERRTNFYKNEGRPDARIISPIVLATAAVALLLKNPKKASKLRQKNIRSPEAYAAAYSEHFPLNAWPVVAALIRAAENAITRAHRASRIAHGQHLAAWRGVLAYVAAVRAIGTYSYTHQDLVALDTARLVDSFMDECWATINRAVGRPGAAKVSTQQLTTIAALMNEKWGVTGQLTDGQRELPPIVKPPSQTNKATRVEDETFIDQVAKALPPQPWRPGMHVQVARELGAKPYRVWNAIQILISRGVFMRQHDGVVYDASGNEIARDAIRERLV
ncbi:AIPR family protein [Xenophilus aerolatus]